MAHITDPPVPSGTYATPNQLPWLVDVDVFCTATSLIGWDAIATNPNAAFNGYKYNTPGAVNDEINFDVVLGAGTWTLEFLYTTSAAGGIITASIDDGAGTFTTLGTVDTYGASAVPNTRTSIAGVVLASTVKRRLRLKMLTKNASSSNFQCYLQHVQLRRTA